jgi:asparagine synthase (glutamine-hydrolysing)
MCGIVGRLGGTGTLPLASLRRRGPDGEGEWTNGRVALGHTRLAVVGDGVQPVFNEDRSVVAVVNGEFYDHGLMRAKLQSQGHRFNSFSDSELICHLYEEHGLDFVHHLRGEFALLLWDEARQTLVAVRDRFGIKPLFYGEHDGGLWIASRPHTLWDAGFPKAFDERAFYHACSTQYAPLDHSLFRGIRQLPPGCRMTVGDSLQIEPYWDLPRWVDDPLPDPVEDFGAALDDAIRCRLPQGPPPAFQLSGGLDSGAVVALAAQSLDPFEAFCVSFDSVDHDEEEQARQLAELWGVKLHIVRLSSQDLLTGLRQAVEATASLAVNGHLTAKFRLAEAIHAAGHKVVLTGEGADEVLLGYPHFRLDLLPGRLDELLQTNPASAGIMLSSAPGLDLSAVQAELGFVPGFLRAKAALGRRLHSVMRPEFLDAFRSYDPYQAMLTPALQGRAPVEQSAYLWNRSALPDYILKTLGDGCEMSHSIEGRLPFLDHPLVELLARVPLALKVHGTIEKWILREAVAPIIPRSLYTRQKHPFMAPPLPMDSLREQPEHPFIDRQRLLAQLDRLPHLPAAEQREWQPALTWLLTAHYLL